MLNVSATTSNKSGSEKLYKLDKIKWVSSWFRRKKSTEEETNNNRTYCVKISSEDLDNHITDVPPPHLSRISSMCLSVGDVMLSSTCPVSPAISQRPMRDLDSDMETLRMSRQDNPFLQLLASRESLANSIEEIESDDVTLMSQEIGGEDPLTLPEIHQHMVRSPPPTSWPRSPAFRFDSSQESIGMRSPRQDMRSPVSHTEPCLLSPRLSLPSKYRSRDSSRERTGGSFSLLTPAAAPLRSLSEVRRHHSRSREDNEHLVDPSSVQ